MKKIITPIIFAAMTFLGTPLISHASSAVTVDILKVKQQQSIHIFFQMVNR
ncbi:hypothetical protein [Psychromonas aquimarina]|uniref:hypothetical protein n=1 Tax=Psychromonas aquimarina TaxID=444919 RepID=UPI0012FC07AD|nr:hypothetical protein [Psychromonas aquimarina]